MSLRYRPDIDGLRAIAVLSVVVFHADHSLLPGGYVGVDVFFVISGYLITSILLKDLTANRFSLSRFYVKRIRRIFPALFLVLFTTSLAAYFVLLPKELVEYGKALFASTFFFANYFFASQAGYFAAPAETNPLLHMWSLAVEEQYYVFFPLALAFVFKFGRKHLLAISLVAVALSLVYAELLVGASPQNAFYSTPARCWELGAGALLAVWNRPFALPRGVLNGLSVVGLGAVAVSLVWLNKESEFPGLAAVPAVFGTALLIATGEGGERTVASQFLNGWPMRRIGQLSYSLYLWHWPIFVLYGIYVIREVKPVETVGLVLLSFLLSALTWRFVENPMRNAKLGLPARKVFLVAFAFAGASAAFSAIVVLSGGLESRIAPDTRALLAAQDDRVARGNCYAPESWHSPAEVGCLLGDNTSAAEPIRFVVWGDSHGGAMYPAFNAAASAVGSRGLFVGRGGCLPLLGVSQSRSGYSSCEDSAAAFMRFLSENRQVRQVILVARWAIYAEGRRYMSEPGNAVFLRDASTTDLSIDENRRAFESAFDRTMQALVDAGVSITLVSQVPETERHVPRALARSKHLGHEIELRPRYADYVARNAFVSEILHRHSSDPRVSLIEMEREMCGDEYCLIREDGIIAYFDANHVSATYARSLASTFEGTIREVIPPE